MSKKILIYGNRYCKNCNVVKNLLQEKNIKYQFVDVDTLDPSERVQLIDSLDHSLGPNARTLPIIFVDSKQIYWKEFIEDL